MSLPSGYTRLEYIESHGTEYFDTGFVPNGNSRVTVDFKGAAVLSVVALFGARSGTAENVFAMWLENNQALPQYGSVAYDAKPITATNTVRHTYDLNKGVATVDGSSVSFTNLTFSAGQTLTLLAMNSAGTVDGRRPSGKLYGAKVYNNTTLVRDFIPAMNASGTIGLWDDVNSTFYTNAGTGTFGYHISKKHKTLIGGTGYEIKSGRVLIGGTGYGIKKGRTLIDGTGYDIGFTRTLGEIDVGTLIKLDENGSPVEFYVAKHDYESGLNGTGRTLLVRKECWDSYRCEGLYYFSNDYIKLFDTDVQSLIGLTKIYWVSSTATWAVTTGLFATFQLSFTELGLSDPLAGIEGTELPIADTLRIAYKDGSPSCQWTRSYPYNQYGFYNYYLNEQGNFASADSTVEIHPTRPAFTLPAETMFDSGFNIIIP